MSQTSDLDVPQLFECLSHMGLVSMSRQSLGEAAHSPYEVSGEGIICFFVQMMLGQAFIAMVMWRLCGFRCLM